MERKNTKELLPIITAFAEGKEIQFFHCGVWSDLLSPKFDKEPFLYRIKPEPKYRPFKSVEECWNEMQKHQPFGWLKSKTSPQPLFKLSDEVSEYSDWDFRFNTLTFADGTPYGIKEK